MIRPRFSIASLLGIVVFLAVALAALREATELCDSALFSAAVALLLVSVLLGVYRTERKRAFWLGFALFGWAYLVLTLVPHIEQRLLTRKGLAYLDSKRISIATADGLAFFDYDGDGDLDLYVAGSSANALYVNKGNGRFQDVTKSSGVIVNNGQPPTRMKLWASSPKWKFVIGPNGTSENFTQIGHTLTAVL
ncbi:MAG TPA: FG-GAP-like repeat-containing protein, partial [Gemmataceae bacterium]|nr:FG-GAP-like repeat-containing protein [Gemmataceae bacterium]